MSNKQFDDGVVNAALSRLPDWQPPPAFASRVARLAVAPQHAPWPWIPSALRALGLATCVAFGAWVVAEMLKAELLSMAAGSTALVWLPAGASLLLAWYLVRRERLLHA